MHICNGLPLPSWYSDSLYQQVQEASAYEFNVPLQWPNNTYPSQIGIGFLFEQSMLFCICHTNFYLHTHAHTRTLTHPLVQAGILESARCINMPLTNRHHARTHSQHTSNLRTRLSALIIFLKLFIFSVGALAAIIHAACTQMHTHSALVVVSLTLISTFSISTITLQCGRAGHYPPRSLLLLSPSLRFGPAMTPPFRK